MTLVTNDFGVGSTVEAVLATVPEAHGLVTPDWVETMVSCPVMGPALALERAQADAMEEDRCVSVPPQVSVP